MTTATESTVTMQSYQVYIKATPETIWDAITTPSDLETLLETGSSFAG
jgi:uncharacterized protein YndB with AHSA1/START domain